MCRRTILAICTVLCIWAAPAGAQSYSDTLSQGPPRTGTVTFTTEVEVTTFEELARTGSDNTKSLMQGGIVLLGGGSLLVAVARRRRTQRGTPAA